MVVYLPVYQTCPLVVRWQVNLYTIRQDTNQLLNQQSLIRSVCVCATFCAHACMCVEGDDEMCLMTIDLWKWRAAGSKQDGRERKEKKWGIVEWSREETDCYWQSITQEDTLITTSQREMNFYWTHALFELVFNSDSSSWRKVCCRFCIFWSTNYFYTLVCVFLYSVEKVKSISAAWGLKPSGDGKEFTKRPILSHFALFVLFKSNS